MTKLTSLRIFASSAIILKALDVATTISAINTGAGFEANPVMAYLFESIGMLPALLLTFVIFSAIVGRLYWARSMRGLKILSFIMLMVVINNSLVIFGVIG